MEQHKKPGQLTAHRHRNDSWRIKVMHWHEQAYREQWSALFSHASLQTSLPLGSMQPLLRDNQQLHVRVKTWSRQLGWSGNTGPTADKQEKGKQISIIDSTIIKALWYMKLNQMMQKRAWRSQHVSTEGTSRQMALCEGLRAENCPSVPLCTKMSKSERLAADVPPDIRDGVAHCKWEENSLKLMAGWRIK